MENKIKQKQTTIIESKKLKDGYSKGKVWNLYGLIDIDGETFTTFDDKLLDRTGKCIVYYTEIENGKFINKRLENIEWEKTEAQSKDKFLQVMEKLDDLTAFVLQIRDIIKKDRQIQS